MGVPAAGADVDLYKSREDYASSNPAYSAEAGEDGKVTFEDIEPGTYYIYAGLDYKSNIILESDQPENGVFTGMGIDGIFDTEANRSEEHTSELQSLMRNSYAVFC